MSITSAAPPVVPAHRRRSDGAAVIPFPRSGLVCAGARGRAGVPRPGGEPLGRHPDREPGQPSARRAGPRSGPTGRARSPAIVWRQEPGPALSGDETRVAPPDRTPLAVTTLARGHLTAVGSSATVTRLDQHRTLGPSDEVRPPARPVVRDGPGPVRLTRRGRLVVGLATLSVAGLLAAVAPALGSRPGPIGAAPAGPMVVVEPGDTLWSIARRIAPDRDTRLVIADLRRLNSLASADVRVGQQLRVYTP